MKKPEHLTIHVHHEANGDLWADVEELPGVFASGRDMSELREALDEAVSLYLSEPGNTVRVWLDVTEEQATVRSA